MFHLLSIPVPTSICTLVTVPLPQSCLLFQLLCLSVSIDYSDPVTSSISSVWHSYSYPKLKFYFLLTDKITEFFRPNSHLQFWFVVLRIIVLEFLNVYCLGQKGNGSLHPVNDSYPFATASSYRCTHFILNPPTTSLTLPPLISQRHNGMSRNWVIPIVNT